MAKFFIFPFGEDGDKATIPDDTQPSGSVSYQEGFGADYQKELGVDPDAKPIPRDQSNQLYYDITNAIRQYQTLGVPDFITEADFGGDPFPYDIYAIVRYNNGIHGFQTFESRKTNNTDLPSVAASWRIISGDSDGVPVGAYIDYAGVTAPNGFLPCDGSAVSRTTYVDLLTATTIAMTGNTTNLSTSVTGLSSTDNMRVGMAVEGTGIQAGTTVTVINSSTAITLSLAANASGSPTLSFYLYGNGNGSTTFNVPGFNRRTAVGSAASGAASATLNNTVGSIGGAETVTLTSAQIPAHTHPLSGLAGQADDAPGSPGSTNVGTAIGGANTLANTGGGGSHNNMQPSLVVFKCIKY